MKIPTEGPIRYAGTRLYLRINYPLLLHNNKASAISTLSLLVAFSEVA